MQDGKHSKNHVMSALVRLLPIFALIIPVAILYGIEPRYFEKTWHGRTYELFFLWLCFLELILNWEELRAAKINKLRSLRTAAFMISLLIPTIYVIAGNYYGLNALIVGFAKSSKMVEVAANEMPLAIEYPVFMGLFVLIILLEYGISNLNSYSVPVFFMGIIGGLYIIDDLYPFGVFTPVQLIVPTTTTLAASVLNLMGYQTAIRFSGNFIPVLQVSNLKGSAAFAIGWPCAGVESLLIYTVVILLFLSKTNIRWWQRTIYFVIGAVVTYFINLLRIATIFVLAIDAGWRPGYMPEVVQRFHDYYGMLYSMAWIMTYPLIIIGSQRLWSRIKGRRDAINSNSTTPATKTP